MVIKSAFGGGPIAVDFMWSSGTGSEDGFASPPSPMFSVLLLLLAAVFHNARARLMKSIGDPIFIFIPKNGNKNANISLENDKTNLASLFLFSRCLSLFRAETRRGTRVRI